MTHDPIRSATERLDEIRSEIGALQAEAREIEGAIKVMRRFTAVPGHVMGRTMGQNAIERSIEETFKRSAPGFQMSQAEFIVIVKRAIHETGRPMTRTQILRWMEANGTPLTGADSNKNAGTKLWRARDLFVNIRGVGYWLRDIPCPAVGYIPTVKSDQIFSNEEAADIPDFEEGEDDL